MSTSPGRALARPSRLSVFLATAAASGCQGDAPGARVPAVDVSEIRIIRDYSYDSTRLWGPGWMLAGLTLLPGVLMPAPTPMRR